MKKAGIIETLQEEERLGKLHSRSTDTCTKTHIAEKSLEETNKKEAPNRNMEGENLNEIYKTVFENSAVAITLTDENERIISWNNYTETLLGMSKEDLYMQPVSFLYPPDEWQKIRSENIRQRGMQYHLETKMIKKNNELIDVDISLSVLKDHTGKTIGSMGIIKDITKRKQIEEILKESEEKFKQLYEKAPVAYHTLSPNGEITDVNEKWCQILGYEKKEVIGRPIFDFVAEKEEKSLIFHLKKKYKVKNLILAAMKERTWPRMAKSEYS